MLLCIHGIFILSFRIIGASFIHQVTIYRNPFCSAEMVVMVAILAIEDGQFSFYQDEDVALWFLSGIHHS